MNTVIGSESRDRPCAVLHLASTFEVKTDTKWLVQIARYLDANRFRMAAACFHGDGPIRGRLEALGVETFNLDTPSERDPRAVLRARRLIEERTFDIVHTHLLRADLFGGAAARWAGVPVIVSTVYAMGQYARAKRRRSDPLLDAACAALPTHAIAVSHAVKRDCVERLGMNPADITVIHTGIDPPATTDERQPAALRKAWGVADGDSLIVTIARLSHEKGIDTLIEAAAIVRESHPDARFVVVGEGPMRGELEKLIGEKGLAGNVHLAGFQEDVWPALAAADVVCMASKSEGMPNALLEAMAVGKAIVATKVGGIPEAIENERNGLLVDAEAPAALASAIGRLLADSAQAERLGRAARATVDERFHARGVVARYGELYERLLNPRGEKSVRVAVAN